MKRVLVVDGDAERREGILAALAADEVEVIGFSGIEQAGKAIMTDADFDLLIADLEALGEEVGKGLKLLLHIKEYMIREVLVLAEYGGKELERYAFRQCGLRFFSKPVDLGRLQAVCRGIGIPAGTAPELRRSEMPPPSGRADRTPSPRVPKRQPRSQRH